MTPRVGSQVVEALDALGVRPRLGAAIRGGDLDGEMAYKFRVSRPPLTREFAVLYQFDQNEEDIYILDFGVLDGDPPRMRPPSF